MTNMASRLCATTMLVAGLVTLSVADANAQAKRNFYCGDGAGSIVVTVLSQQKISVAVDLFNSADGKFTMTMQKQGAGFRFVNGEYEVKINNTQDSMIYFAPDFGEIGCAWDRR